MMNSSNIKAQTYIANGSGAWENSSNWNPAPQSWDTQTLSGGLSSGSVSVSGSIVRVGNITLGNTLTVSGSLTVNSGNVTGNSLLTVNSGASLTVNGTMSASLTVAGTATINGDFTSGINVTVQNGGLLIITGNLYSASSITVASGGTLIVLGSANISGGTNNLDGNVIVKGDFNVTGGSDTKVNTNGNLVVGGNFSLINTGFTLNGSTSNMYILNPAATVTLPAPPTTNNICNGTTCNYGNNNDFLNNEGSDLINLVNTYFGCAGSWGQVSNVSCCVGSQASFYAINSSGASYQWQVSTNGGSTWTDITASSLYSGVTGPTLVISATTAAMSGYKYHCIVSGGSCSTATTSNAATLTVNSGPAITTQPQNAIFCSSSGATFSVTASGTSLTYQWQYSNDGTTWTNPSNYPYSNYTTNTLTVNNNNAATYYHCIVTSSSGCSTTSNTVTLTWVDPANFSYTPASATVCSGGTVSFSAPNITGGSSFQWQYFNQGQYSSSWDNLIEGGIYSGTTTSTLVLSNLNLSAGTYKYRCVICNCTWCTNNPVSLVVTSGSANSISLTSASGTDAQTVCINNPITNITYNTTGATGASFSGLPTGVSGSWSGNVATISGIPTVSSGTAYSYAITLTGGCGTVTKNGTITVNPLPVTGPAYRLPNN